MFPALVGSSFPWFSSRSSIPAATRVQWQRRVTDFYLLSHVGGSFVLFAQVRALTLLVTVHRRRHDDDDGEGRGPDAYTLTVYSAFNQQPTGADTGRRLHIAGPLLSLLSQV